MERWQDHREQIVAAADDRTYRLLTLLIAGTAGAQAAGTSRVALVIGNSDYPSAPLRNAVNDARAMSSRLTRLGFEVISAENADRKAMEKAIFEFSSRLEGETAGLFFYAGHGIQSKGRNYLVPVDASLGNDTPGGCIAHHKVDVTHGVGDP